MSIAVTPLVHVIPNEAAVPALVLVGFLMMQQVKAIEWDDLEIAIPAFLTIILMPFTYSISVGIGAGFIAFVVIKLVRGKARDIHPMIKGGSLGEIRSGHGLEGDAQAFLEGVDLQRRIGFFLEGPTELIGGQDNVGDAFVVF